MNRISCFFSLTLTVFCLALIAPVTFALQVSNASGLNSGEYKLSGRVDDGVDGSAASSGLDRQQDGRRGAVWLFAMTLIGLAGVRLRELFMVMNACRKNPGTQEHGSGQVELRR